MSATTEHIKMLERLIEKNIEDLKMAKELNETKDIRMIINKQSSP